MRGSQFCVALVLGLALLSACDTAPSPPPQAAATTAAQPAQPAQTSAAAKPGTNPYPASGQAAQEATSYPPPGASVAQVATQGPYPPPTETPVAGFKFTFNQPLKKGDTQVSGTGPEGLPIRIVDISQNGQQLATTVIGSDGTFKVDVAGGLMGGNQLGIQIGDLKGTKYKPEDFIYGPGYTDMPQMGMMVAVATIE